MNEVIESVGSLLGVSPEREVEVMLWRAALALGADEAGADAALTAVWRRTGRPAGASESRLLKVVVESVRGAGASIRSDTWRAEDSPVWRLVRVGGVPGNVVAHAMDWPGDQVDAEVARGDREIDGGRAREMGERVAAADAGAALLRVDALTRGLRRWRTAMNLLKYGVFFVVLGLVVYVMLDLREAARLEKAKQTPGDVYSLPMPKGEGTGH
jgi:hypothetical protein